MSEVQLSRIDLNLLVVLDALLKHRSVTRAAEQLHVTPSAVSHSLKRLRSVFGDELLFREGRQMRLTLRAQGLSETLPRVLQQVRRTLSAPVAFQPSTSTRTFRLSAPDFLASVVPALLQAVGRTAPSVRVEVLPLGQGSIREVTEGRTDALIGPSALEGEGVRAAPLGAWDWAVFGRKGHPAFRDWSLHAWSCCPHLKVGTSELRGSGPIDRRTSELGIERVIGAVVPSFTMAASVLAQTNLLLTVPSVTLADVAVDHGLEQHPVPFELPRMQLSVFRSAVAGEEPGVRWFLDQVRQVAGALVRSAWDPEEEGLQRSSAAQGE